MEFLSTSEILNARFEQLCYSFNNFEWVVAWAGNTESFNVGSLLERFENKIVHMVVGLHFYQTHPAFIGNFMNNSSVHFIKQTDGVFHPKLYLFYNNRNDWAAIMGSANFTASAFNKNIEADILITSNDANSDFFDSMRSFIKDQWNNATQFDANELDNYKQCWKKQQHLRDSLSKTLNISDDGRFITRPLDIKTWDEYKAEVIKNPGYYVRLRLLSTAQKLFGKPFASLSEVDRKRLAGCPSQKDNQLNEAFDKYIDWRFFGTIFGKGIYSHLIIENEEHIARAIDSIPQKGEITKKHYEAYICEFRKCSSDINNPLALSTRLLAMKRPDVFICVNGENKEGLCLRYGIKKSKLNVDTYWDLLIKHIRMSVWYNTPNTDPLYQYRAAMLDCLYYMKGSLD